MPEISRRALRALRFFTRFNALSLLFSALGAEIGVHLALE